MHEELRPFASNVAPYLALGFVETEREPVAFGHLVHPRKALT